MNQTTTNNIPARTARDIIISPRRGSYMDEKVISSSYYNPFNYSKLPEKYRHIKLSMGITSANGREGKTLVAANLATSFALGYKRKTVIVDLNINRPKLHKIFGIGDQPGLIESLNDKMVLLCQTRIDQLFVLTAGDWEHYSLGLKDLTAIRDIIYTLEREFEFVILDMDSILPIDKFPALFANEVDGLMIVVDSKKTKQRDIEDVFHYIDQNQILGFVMNRMKNGRDHGGKK